MDVFCTDDCFFRNDVTYPKEYHVSIGNGFLATAAEYANYGMGTDDANFVRFGKNTEVFYAPFFQFSKTYFGPNFVLH